MSACLHCGSVDCECAEGPVYSWGAAKHRHRETAIAHAADQCAKHYPHLAAHIVRVQQETDKILRRRGFACP